MDFFYDEAVRRYLLQFIRIFSDIKVQSGEDENGVSVQKRVPVRYADMSKMVAHILADGNQNIILPVPMMTVWIQNMELAPERRNDPAFVGKVQHTEREWDQEEGDYTTASGQKYTIERYMPIPYNLTMVLDIWTTNTTDKLQLIEQISSIFNPSVQLQQNSNIIDWSSIFEVELTDIAFTNRTMPIGTEYEKDICTFTFKVPIWINPPAKVKVQKLIHQIVSNVYDGLEDDDLDNYKPFSDRDELSQLIITPNNHTTSIGVDSAPNELMLLNKYAGKDENLSWKTLIEQYGQLQETSTVTLKLDGDIESSDGDIIGTISLHPTKQNILLWNVDQDTLPVNTMSPVSALVSPKDESPGNGLPDAVEGARYLLVSEEDAPSGQPLITETSIWGVEAYENDIIMYSGSKWHVVFDHKTATDTEYMMDLSTMNQYRFNGNEWEFTYLGVYRAGYWRIQI